MSNVPSEEKQEGKGSEDKTYSPEDFFKAVKEFETYLLTYRFGPYVWQALSDDGKMVLRNLVALEQMGMEVDLMETTL